MCSCTCAPVATASTSYTPTYEPAMSGVQPPQPATTQQAPIVDAVNAVGELEPTRSVQPVEGGAGSTGFVFPVAGTTTNVGDPHQGTHTIGNWQSDNAMDIGAPEGTPVYATTSGVIELARGSNYDPNDRFNGFNFELGGSDNRWFYQHLSKSLVTNGDYVEAGQIIGYVGSGAGVPHLHIGQKSGDIVATLGRYGPEQG